MRPHIGVLDVVVVGDILREDLLDFLVIRSSLLLGGVHGALLKEGHDLVVVVAGLVGGGVAPHVGEGVGVGAAGAAGGAHIPLQVLIQILGADSPLVALYVELDAHGVQILGHQGGDVGGAKDGGGEATVGQLKAITIRASLITGLVQDLVGLLHVIARVFHIPVHSPLHGGGVPVVAGLHIPHIEHVGDVLVVDGPADRLTDPDVGDIGAGCLLTEVELGPLDNVGSLGVHGDPVHGGQAIRLGKGGGGGHPTHLAGLKGGGGGGQIGGKAVDNLIQVGAVAVVIRVGLQAAVVAGLILHELERAGADGVLVGRIGVGVRALVDMGGQDVRPLVVAYVLHKGAAGVRHMEDHCVVIRGLHRLHHADVGVGIGLVAILQNAVEGPLHVRGGEGLAVMPGNTLTQVEGPGHQIVRGLPGLRQIGDHGLGILIPVTELGEDVVADIHHAAIPLVVGLVIGGLQGGGDH